MSEKDALTEELDSILNEEGHRLSTAAHLEALLGIPAGRLELSLSDTDTPELDENGEPVTEPWRLVHTSVHDLMEELEVSMDITKYVMDNERRKMRRIFPEDHPIAQLLDYIVERENEEPTDG